MRLSARELEVNQCDLRLAKRQNDSATSSTQLFPVTSSSTRSLPMSSSTDPSSAASSAPPSSSNSPSVAPTTSTPVSSPSSSGPSSSGRPTTTTSAVASSSNSTTPPAASSTTTPTPSTTAQASPSSSTTAAPTTTTAAAPSRSASTPSSYLSPTTTTSRAPASSQQAAQSTQEISPQPLFPTASTSEYTLTTSGSVVIVTSVVTNVVSGVNPAESSGVAGGKTLNGATSGSSNSFFSNTGAVAGTFVVVGLVIAGLLAGLAFFFFRRKRRRQLDEDLRVAAGGAGAGGAGVSRFDDDDDDLEDPFNPPNGSETAFISSPRMSSYNNASIPTSLAYAQDRRASAALSNHRLSYGSDPYTPALSAQSHMPFPSPFTAVAAADAATAAPAPGVYGGYAYADLSHHQQQQPPLGATTRSHEGALHDDWAEYVQSTTGPRQANTAGGAENGISHPDVGGSGEGAIQGSAATSLHRRLSSTPSAYSVGATTPGLTTTMATAAPAHSGDGPGADLLDPAKMAARRHEHENESQVSLQDEHDYSRPILRVANGS